MKESFKQELLQNYLELIVEKSKESEMLIASGRGLLSQVAKLINRSVFSFLDMGLKVRYGYETVRYRLITSGAHVSMYSDNEIEVVLGLACSPNEIKGRVRLTKKEAEIASELQKIWDHNVNNNYFYDRDKYKKKAEELSFLTHRLECYREYHYQFGLDDFYQKRDLLSEVYVFGGLTDNAIEASTRDLIPLEELFGRDRGTK